MKPFFLALLMTLILGQAAFSSNDPDHIYLQPHPPIVVDAGHGNYPKRTFAERHPKLHKVGRKIRRVCTVLLPVVNFVGGCAQIVTAVRS